MQNRYRMFRRWCRCVLAGDGVIPKSVQILPFLARHLRARIFLVRVLRRNVLGPLRQERAGGRFPVRTERTEAMRTDSSVQLIFEFMAYVPSFHTFTASSASLLIEGMFPNRPWVLAA